MHRVNNVVAAAAVVTLSFFAGFVIPASAQSVTTFEGGSLAQCRIYSKYLALQIKACELGLLPRARTIVDVPRVRPDTNFIRKEGSA